MELTPIRDLSDLSTPILLTGHTGFKGTWMTFLLEHLKVPVIGFSLAPEQNSLFSRTNRRGAIPEIFSDIRNYSNLENFIDLHKPSAIIHMAAQPLVLKSYESPRETFDVNIMGTVNMLDIAFKKEFVKAIIVITTDKVYRNNNSGQAFIESDPLEGKDPYSASKVGTEAAVAAWQQISKVNKGPQITSVRAGNVIGGGDFAEDRLVPDIIRGIIDKTATHIRNPNSVRPWQHVLDPNYGYLLLLLKMLQGKQIESLNFGPDGTSISVSKFAQLAKQIFPESRIEFSEQNTENYKESSNLNLISIQSNQFLGWKQRYDQTTAILKTFEWWENYFANPTNARQLCEEEVSAYISNLIEI
jgi:CDP-glucose 4,6-dehydratase